MPQLFGLLYTYRLHLTAHHVAQRPIVTLFLSEGAPVLQARQSWILWDSREQGMSALFASTSDDENWTPCEEIKHNFSGNWLLSLN